ncbi:MAG: hypothetical protein AAGA68_23675 [Pseudomonadota bacterium]
MTNTTETTTTPYEQPPVPEDSNRPTHIVRKKRGPGRKSDFETLGVAWAHEDGKFYVKLYGTQVIEGGFYVFPNRNDNPEAGR